MITLSDIHGDMLVRQIELDPTSTEAIDKNKVAIDGVQGELTLKQINNLASIARLAGHENETFLDALAKLRQQFGLSPAQKDFTIIERARNRQFSANAANAIGDNQRRVLGTLMSLLGRNKPIAGQPEMNRNAASLSDARREQLLDKLMSVETNADYSNATTVVYAFIGEFDRSGQSSTEQVDEGAVSLADAQAALDEAGDNF